jgi:plasmid stabilization system protein ParE
VRIDFVGQAKAEFLAAIEFYESQEPGLGRAFAVDVEQAVDLAVRFPSIGSPAPSNTRRFLLRRFPYSIVYLSTTDSMWVIAVEHHRRKPGFWENRL